MAAAGAAIRERRRPCNAYAGNPLHLRDDIDLVDFRENTEGLYSGIEHEVVPGVVESIKIMTRTACERICRFAFDLWIRRTREWRK